MTALEMIAELEWEITQAANCLARLETLGANYAHGSTRRIIDGQAELICKRIRRAQGEIFAIEEAFFAEIQTARRDAKYRQPEIKPLVIEIM